MSKYNARTGGREYYTFARIVCLNVVLLNRKLKLDGHSVQRNQRITATGVVYGDLIIRVNLFPRYDPEQFDDHSL